MLFLVGDDRKKNVRMIFLFLNILLWNFMVDLYFSQILHKSGNERQTTVAAILYDYKKTKQKIDVKNNDTSSTVLIFMQHQMFFRPQKVRKRKFKTP